MTRQEAIESEGNRDLSQSERACEVAKGVLVLDMVWDLREPTWVRREKKELGKEGVCRLRGREEKNREIAVRKRSWRVGRN
ncbi:hypothetical protein V6N12_070436 [Hibiscus sabdariffa]|uniref:Uncharacterized protein n=1 Tax=Hibiscus sabdariffa TaxID=183260 RepID=A0ABR2FGT5_9ROSI